MLASVQTEQSQNAAPKSPGSIAQAEPDEAIFTVRKAVNEAYLVFTCHSPKFRLSLESTDCEISSDPHSAMNSTHVRLFVALVRRPASPVSISRDCND